MKIRFQVLPVVVALGFFAGGASAQVDDICGEFGVRPLRDDPGIRVSYLYGRIVVKGYDAAKFPKVIAVFLDPKQSSRRLTIERSGNYCFRRSDGGGTLVVEVEGVETTRRTISGLGPAHIREDLEIQLTTPHEAGAPPGVVSAKLARPRNDKTVDLYTKTAEAEAAKNQKGAIRYVKQIVEIDPADYIAWAKLGSLYFELKSYADAETAFKRAVELKPDYTSVWINLGTIRALENQFEGAIEIFKQAIATDPTSARAYRFLGEAYLQVRRGSLAIEAFNEAIRLEPIAMAECHLLMARLYDLAGAKNLAAREYQAFLSKVPNDPDRKKFEKYIKDNPDSP